MFRSRSDHCKYVSAKASKSLNFLCHTLWGATTEAKSMTYKCLVRMSTSGVCVHGVEPSHFLRQSHIRISPTTHSAVAMWESLVSKSWSRSSDVCLQELHWLTLSSCRKYLSVYMMYDILHGQYNSLPTSIYLIFT